MEYYGRSTRKESPSYPSTALSYEFLSCVFSVKRKQKKRREREVREESYQGCYVSGSVLQGVEETGSKETESQNKAQSCTHHLSLVSPYSLSNLKKPFLLFTDRFPLSSSGNPLSLMLRQR